jgi:tRNA-2-methylthio-N6-dimethylallyladenosine synthase
LVDRLKAISLQHNLDTVGQTVPVFVEGDAKKSSSQWMGKTDGGITVVWEKGMAPLQPGTLVPITVTRVTATTLFGHPVAP